jgi:two-component system nitrogen regulation response regulator NtrX
MALIVVVDDDPLFTHAVTSVLGFAGYAVSSHLTLKGGLEFLGANTADLLVADLHLEDGSGWDLIAFAREHQPDLRVVVVSGYYDALAEENARRFGVAVLTKPIDLDDLINVINGMISDR